LEVFQAFAGGASEMDGRSFVKLMRTSTLLDQSSLKTSDADLIFVRNKTKGARKINFGEFIRCLAEVSEKKGMDEEEVVDLVSVATSMNMQDMTSMQSGNSMTMTNTNSSTGPERFFYDKSTYTGTHRHGGPSIIGGGQDDGDVIRDSMLMNRELETEKGGIRRKNSPLPVLLGGALPSTNEKSVEEEKPGPLGPLSQLSMSHTGSTGTRPRSPERHSTRRSKSPMGPERFFYDKSTYTGTHRHGGPSIHGNGLPKDGGYDDLSKLVNRAVVQDDALHRKRMSPSQKQRRDQDIYDHDYSMMQQNSSQLQMTPQSSGQLPPAPLSPQISTSGMHGSAQMQSQTSVQQQLFQRRTDSAAAPVTSSPTTAVTHSSGPVTTVYRQQVVPPPQWQPQQQQQQPQQQQAGPRIVQVQTHPQYTAAAVRSSSPGMALGQQRRSIGPNAVSAVAPPTTQQGGQRVATYQAAPHAGGLEWASMAYRQVSA